MMGPSLVAGSIATDGLNNPQVGTLRRDGSYGDACHCLHSAGLAQDLTSHVDKKMHVIRDFAGRTRRLWLTVPLKLHRSPPTNGHHFRQFSFAAAVRTFWDMRTGPAVVRAADCNTPSMLCKKGAEQSWGLPSFTYHFRLMSCQRPGIQARFRCTSQCSVRTTT